MTTASLALAALRGALVFGIALAAMPVLRSASAATRRLVLALAVTAVVLLPIATAMLPPLRVLVPGGGEVIHAARVGALAPEPITPLADTPAPAVAASVAPEVARSIPARDSAPSLPQVLLAIWALGALAVLARYASGLWRARTLSRDARLVELVRSGSRLVEVRATRAVDSPAVVGLVKPVILVPHESTAWSAERRQLVLQHELAHVARRDPLVGAVAQLASALHWFDPLAWLVVRRLRVERELAADDRVLAEGARASTYAEHLLGLATIHGPELPAGALAMAQPSQIAARIQALLEPGRARAPLARTRFVALVASSALLVAAVACATPSRSRTPTSSPSTAAGAVTRRGGASLGAIPAGELTIDPALQAIAEDETDRLVKEWAPRAAVVLVLEPSTGNVLALTSRSSDGREVATEHARMPGSTMKPVTVAAALEEGAIRADQRFDCENGQRTYGADVLRDASPNGLLDVSGVLAVSSNVGVSKIFDELGGAKLVTWMQRFHLAEKPAVPLPAIAGSLPVAPADRSFRGAILANGGDVLATPLQVAAAYATIANGGLYHTPTLVRRTDPGERVLREETARTVMGLLEVVVTAANGTGAAARVENVRVAGKTGTAEFSSEKPSAKPELYASFVGIAPLEAPRYVVLVGVEGPRGGGSGGRVAAPVFARLVKRALAR